MERHLAPPRAAIDTVVLVGLESVGKSAVFRALTGSSLGEERNVRGSTISCRLGRAANAAFDVLDTPGMSLEGDTEATRMAMVSVRGAKAALLVARITHAAAELGSLLSLVADSERVAVALSFSDKVDAATARHYIATLQAQLRVPVIGLDARRGGPLDRNAMFGAIARGARLEARGAAQLPALPSNVLRLPARSWLEAPFIGRPLALLATALIFALPVYLAYLSSDALTEPFERLVLEPARRAVSQHFGEGSLVYAAAAGPYGLVTLGSLSVIWALPVVALLGGSVALAEDSGLKDRIADTLDPWLRRCGLSGRDLVPLLGGYGCNVVAVLQSRASSHCTRGACVSQIALGSACSYQLGATLAVFSAAALPSLFVPYLLLLLVVGGLHTRFWYGSRAAVRLPLVQTTYLQWPALRVVCWRGATQLRQFLTQALPAFTLMCLVAAALDHWGFLSVLSSLVRPLGSAMGLDERAIGAVALSLVRKDGLLLLIPNAAEPSAAASLLLAVWLGSTLSACSVTLWTIGRELGLAHAWRIAYRQALTALGSSLLLASVIPAAGRP